MWTSKQCLIGEELGNAERGRAGHGGRLTLLWQDTQKSIGTTQAAVVCVGASHICVCAHVCPDAGGRLAGREKHLLWTLGLS